MMDPDSINQDLIKKNIIFVSSEKFFSQFLVVKILDPDLDPDPDSDRYSV